MHLGQSALLAEAFGREEGDAPIVDLEAERRNGAFVRASARRLNTASDLSDGGLALAAFEMADAADLGLRLDIEGTAELFGEDQARYLVAVDASEADAVVQAAETAGVPAARVGSLGGSDVVMGGISAPREALSALYRTSFEAAVV
jgi:phosphoribosylformylglycinamidine synthase